MPQPSPLLPIQLAAMEAAHVAWEMLSEGHRENFIAERGGAALLFHGATIITHDADLAVNADSYTKFINLAKDDPRFDEAVFGVWEYTSSYDFLAKVDFSNRDRDRDCIHELGEYSLIDGIPVATPIDLVIGKGTAWVERKNPKKPYWFGIRCGDDAKV